MKVYEGTGKIIFFILFFSATLCLCGEILLPIWIAQVSLDGEILAEAV